MHALRCAQTKAGHVEAGAESARRGVIRCDVFVSDVFSSQGGQHAILAVSACNTPASIEPSVFGAGHAFQPSP